MVKYNIYLLLIVAVALLTACGKKELTYDEAAKLFKVGMTQNEAEGFYGRPQVVDKSNDLVDWYYFPVSKVTGSQAGEFTGFIIEFKGNAAIRIYPHTIVKGPMQ